MPLAQWSPDGKTDLEAVAQWRSGAPLLARELQDGRAASLPTPARGHHGRHNFMRTILAAAFSIPAPF